MVHLIEDPALRNRRVVFRDRSDAGRRLAAFVKEHCPVENPLIGAIPAGGVPVGLELAERLQAPLFLGIVRKLKVPWNPEAGFGSMTWNGKIYLNHELVRILNLSDELWRRQRVRSGNGSSSLRGEGPSLSSPAGRLSSPMTGLHQAIRCLQRWKR